MAMCDELWLVAMEDLAMSGSIVDGADWPQNKGRDNLKWLYLTVKVVFSGPQCEIKKIDLSIIDFSCPSRMSNSPRRIHWNSSLGAVPCRHSEKSRFNRSKARIGQPRKSCGSGTKRPSSRPTRVPHATVPSSSSPARKHTAKFEPGSWSWAQMMLRVRPVTW